MTPGVCSDAAGMESRNLVLAPAALLVSFLLAEGVLRVFTEEWTFLDPRTDAYWKATVRTAGRPSFATPAGRNMEFDARLGWRMKRGFQEEGVRHDARGFRLGGDGPAGASPLRVLAIGDSFTYGRGVRGEETFSAQLARQSGAHVVNAGVNGFGVDQALLMWEEEGRALRPDVVVLGYFVDDFYRNGLTLRDGPKPHFVRDAADAPFRLAGVPVPRFDAFEASGGLAGPHSLRTLAAVGLCNRRLQRALGNRDPMLDELAAVSGHVLRRLRESVEAAGARLLVLIIPHCEYDDFLDARWIVEALVEECLRSEIDCLDFAEPMEQADEGQLYGGDCRWTAEGHRFAAEALAGALGLAEAE